MEITDIAWFSGLFDGEGCVYIHKAIKSKGCINPIYCLRLSLALTHFPTVEKIKALFGGFITYYRGGAGKRIKNQARWQVAAALAKEVLIKILPFSVVKKKEIEIALCFANLEKASKYKETPDWLLKKREQFYQEIKEAKKIRFEIVTHEEKKKYKKDQWTICPICELPMRAFSANGQIKKACSRSCGAHRFPRWKEKEIFNTFVLFNQKMNKINSIKKISCSLDCPIGTIKDIIKRNKKNANISAPS